MSADVRGRRNAAYLRENSCPRCPPCQNVWFWLCPPPLANFHGFVAVLVPLSLSPDTFLASVAGETSFRFRSPSWGPKWLWKSREQGWSAANISWKQMFCRPTQTPGFTRWARKTPGTRLDVEVSRLLVRREALFVRKDGPDVCGSCNEKTACARVFLFFRKSS